jgi:GTP-binding protein HflX
LQNALSEHFRRDRRNYQLHLPPAAGRLRALLYERFGVVNEKLLPAGGWEIDIDLDPAQLAWLCQLPDFESEYLVSPDPVLAATGS